MYRTHQKRREKFRINEDTMTNIVMWSLRFCVLVVISGMALAFYGIDVSAIVASALAVFGTELGICGIMTIHKRSYERIDRKEDERRRRREEKKEVYKE